MDSLVQTEIGPSKGKISDLGPSEISHHGGIARKNLNSEPTSTWVSSLYYKGSAPSIIGKGKGVPEDFTPLVIADYRR